MDDQEAIISLDAANDERFEMSQSVADFCIRSMIAAPLLNSDGESIGAIQIDTLEQRNRFQEKDLEVLLAVATQAGIAIENAQLHEKAVQQKLVEQDLELAKQVQIAFLPAKPIENEDVCCYQYYNAANAIGGDYFDYIRLNDDKIAIVVADVVGHGVAAAMFMAKLSAETRFAFAREKDPTTAMTLLNRRLYDLGIEKMVTALVIVLHPKTGLAQVINAGHMPPLLRRADGTLCEPSEIEAGLPLGIVDEEIYNAAEFTLEPGDCFAMYTDGIFEAPNTSGKQFSINRLRELVTAGGGNVDKTGKSIIDAVELHVGNAAQEDDMCLVVIGRPA
jgi:serine phosphatase RsbU (regulator of sigma subunit)